MLYRILVVFIILLLLSLTTATAQAATPLSGYEKWSVRKCISNGGTWKFCYHTVLATRRIKGVRSGYVARPSLVKLVRKESSMQYWARNRWSGACGWYQFLPCRAHAYVGVPGRTTHSVAGLRYIFARYGGPDGAWRFWLAHHWY